ncbi:hypothetical protein KA005_75395, partial [bacterium]|nr:hypothetical protein [bacterium]
MDGDTVTSCTFTVNITNKYNGIITVKYLDLWVDLAFNVSKDDITAVPSGFTMDEPYFSVGGITDITFSWNLYGNEGQEDKFVNFTANESKIINITVQASDELLEQISEEGRKDYWIDWYFAYQNPQGF